MPEITVQELIKRISNNEEINLIDVRETWEFDEDNIGAMSMPLGDLPHRIAEIVHLKNQEVIVHCQSGGRSAQAQKYLTSRGFENVASLAGGMMAYRAAESTM